MTMASSISAKVDRSASLNVRTLVLPRAKWEKELIAGGREALRPQPGTWYGHVVRGQGAHEVTVIPFVGCPACKKLLLLSHSPDAARALASLSGMPVPVSHAIDHLGRVSPDARCAHAGCSFHRRLILDKWNTTKSLYAIAYVDLSRGDAAKIEIDYCHAVDRREALFHFGVRKKSVRVIDAGKAVGFFVDEKTGKVSVE